ncbi:MAG: hypothetical protein JXO72_07330 [Vicinamibacteria bacterium]|nr:hypothetical protein [Vicinamibacteria bacterium]
MTNTHDTVRVSPVDAISRAITQVRNQLFPFRFDRWLALGLVAFLDQCGRAGGGGGGGNWGRSGDSANELILKGADWIDQHVMLVVALAAAALILIVAVMAVVLWLNSRGTFMYIDNVATGRADVVRPWREHARPANSYFTWKFGLALATLVATIVIVVPLLIAIVVIARRGPSLWPIVTVVATALALLLTSAAVALLSTALRDFVAPIQLWSGASCGGALRLFKPLLHAHLGAFVIYVLLKIVYAMVVGITVIALVCGTCLTLLCCLVLPIISQTILQPLYYFERAWSLQFLASMGFDLSRTLLPPAADAVVPAR